MEGTPLARGATRWWSAPARFATVPLAQLRKAVLHHYAAHQAWLRHAPVGIRDQMHAGLRSLRSR